MSDAENPALHEPRRRGTRILVIDDDRMMRSICRRALEQEGHEVVEAFDGASGVRMFRENPTAVVVCDIFMPEKDGLETLREIMSEYSGVKVIIISGGAPGMPSFLGVARQLGAAAALAKPFRPDELVAAVRGALSEVM